MKILFVGSEKLQALGAVAALHAMGHEIAFYPEPAESTGEDEKHEERFGDFLCKNKVDFVLAHIFIPAIARQTKKYEVKYAIYSMDSPMYTAWCEDAFQAKHCYLFYFDAKEYRMVKKLGCKNAYYLPLAADFIQASNLVITDDEIKKNQCDISFVGGLYSENLYDVCVQDFPVRFQELFDAIMEGAAFRWDGGDRIAPFLTKEVIEVIKRICPTLMEDLKRYGYNMPEAYYIKQRLFARKLTNIERTLLLNLLAEQYGLHLYTREREIVPPNIKRFPEIEHREAYKIFYSSKINLNITLRSIESGVPLRIFDIMSVGGFVLSNWQEEMTELFEEDKEIVLFKTPEEMLEKIDYYLSHEKERVRIGINGYQKVKNCYTYEHQLNKIISILFPMP